MLMRKNKQILLGLQEGNSKLLTVKYLIVSIWGVTRFQAFTPPKTSYTYFYTIQIN